MKRDNVIRSKSFLHIMIEKSYVNGFLSRRRNSLYTNRPDKGLVFLLKRLF